MARGQGVVIVAAERLGVGRGFTLAFHASGGYNLSVGVKSVVGAATRESFRALVSLQACQRRAGVAALGEGSS